MMSSGKLPSVATRQGLVHPQPQLMMSASLICQVHAITPWFLFAIWPFTLLVHACSVPIWYLWRPYILYRRQFAVRSIPMRQPYQRNAHKARRSDHARLS